MFFSAIEDDIDFGAVIAGRSKPESGTFAGIATVRVSDKPRPSRWGGLLIFGGTEIDCCE
jgi:hypothetical protein